jgi:hypothetical protein
MIGELATPHIEELLKSEVMGRIGCHHAGTTYIVPTSYAYDGTYIYVHTHEGMKVEMMRKNPAVCFQVDNMRDMANWQSVIAWGTYEELPPAKIAPPPSRRCRRDSFRSCPALPPTWVPPGRFRRTAIKTSKASCSALP